MFNAQLFTINDELKFTQLTSTAPPADSEMTHSNSADDAGPKNQLYGYGGDCNDGEVQSFPSWDDMNSNTGDDNKEEDNVKQIQLYGYGGDDPSTSDKGAIIYGVTLLGGGEDFWKKCVFCMKKLDKR